MLDSARIRAIAMEPEGDEFKRITGAAGAGIKAAQSRDPTGADFLDRLEGSVDALLKKHWDELADTQDQLTADVSRALAMIQGQIYGASFVESQNEWDGFMASRVVETVRDNPGKRIVVLGSFRNRALLTEAVIRAAPERVVDVEAYLRRGEVVSLATSRVAAEPK
jgi:hypothetical protein